MNETIQSNSTSNDPWLTRDQRVPTSDATTLPDSAKTAPSALGLLNNAVQGAYNTIDRIAESTAPAARQLGDSVAAATEAMHANAAQLRVTRDEWVEASRSTVRSNPLVSVAAAFALGILFARITR